jgi:hypothetical protein
MSKGELAERRPVAKTGMDRFLIAIVTGTILLVVVGVAVAASGAGTAAHQRLEAGTPAAVVQEYVEALQSGNLDHAYALLSTPARAAWSRDRYQEDFPRYVPPSGVERRLLIEPIKSDATSALVRVTVSRFLPGNPLFMGTSHQEVDVYLVPEGGAWKIDRPVEPYPFLG